MADLSVTAANVAKISGTVRTVTAGASIAAGDAVYRDTTDANEYKGCRANVLASSKCEGIALDNAENGQPLTILTHGTIDIGATVSIGEVYTVSGHVSTGKIAPHSDLGSNEFVTVIGVGITTARIKMNLLVSDVALP
jgi:hypothetical protein